LSGMGEGGGGDGGTAGGIGGGGVHRAESPAKSRLRPPQPPDPEYVTVKVASTWPRSGRKKNCTPLLACSLVRLRGSMGLSPVSGDGPTAVPVNVLVPAFAKTVEAIASPVFDLRGVL